MTSTQHTSTPPLPGDDIDASRVAGHWLLARLGKRVLRPGGRQMTESLLAELDITSSDDVVELAPGLGETTRLVLERTPRSYTGIERDEHAAGIVRSLLTDRRYRCEIGTAQQTGLDDATASVVFGEAFMTMQSDDHKQHIADEAFRILRAGGRYGVHELAIRPENATDELRDDIRGALSRSIHVGARPVTATEWRTILQRAGFEITYDASAPMALLQPKRLIADEGPLRAAKIAINILRSREARRRVRSMRKTLRHHAGNLGAVAMVARKP